MKLKKIYKAILGLFVVITINSCGFFKYSFTGADIGTAKTYEVRMFQNYATQSPGSTFEPGLDRDFTQALQNLILDQTSLSLTNSNGDLLYEGEITEFRISPMTATADQTAAQNRLSMRVNVRFFNNTKEDEDFEKPFSFFFDYPDNSSFNSVKAEALTEIFERITQDIFNESLANW